MSTEPNTLWYFCTIGGSTSELRMGLRPTYRYENRIELQAFTIELAWNGEGRGYSGSVEAVSEFGLGSVFEPICVAPPIPVGRLVARDGV
jgi:hypothetical protein